MTAAGPDPGRRVADALGARSGGAVGRAGGGRTRRGSSARTQIAWALLIGLLAGGVLGTVLALLSILSPGLLPALG